MWLTAEIGSQMSEIAVSPQRQRWMGRHSNVSLRTGLGGRRNSLGLIRLVLAAAVIVSHGFPLGGFGQDPLVAATRHQISIGEFAVFGFFAISGYLIMKSGMRSDILTFLWHRFLRIFPAFWVALLVGALLVGPLVWWASGHPISQYLSAGPVSPVQYLVGNWRLAIAHYGIADLFLNTPYGHRVHESVLNGSLWTLIHEWTCYLIVAAFVLFGIARRPRLAQVIVPSVAAIFLIAQVASEYMGVELMRAVPMFHDPDRVRLVFVFLIGACIAVFADVIKVDDRLAIAAAVVGVAAALIGGFQVFGLPALAYLLLWLAARLPERFTRVGAKNDYSYGIYVYGFLVQQVLAFLGLYRLGYVPFVVAALVATALIAWCSWHLIESPALSLKNRGPGRGVKFFVDRIRGRWRRPKGDLDGDVKQRPPANADAARSSDAN